jgi:nucleoid-associated protein YgaU
LISNNSRYVNSALVTQTKDDGTQVIVITPSDAVAYTFTYTYYAVTGADRIDTIANAFYGDPSKWWKIGDANPEIMKWDSIPPGTVLRIPNA